MALIRKNAPTNASATKQQVIKINPYENPDNVMELMAKICSATPTADTNLFWNVINDAYNKQVRGKSLREYLQENRGNLKNADFDYDLKEWCHELSWSLSTRENSSHTQIVVAGGFSSGKSSFLNKLTQSKNLLPTGVEPVSVVKTYLFCSSNCHSVLVRGVNQKNVLVQLEPGVLQAIQHAKKSNIYLASVLDKLFVEIPSTKLNGIVFIDTPGYNNTDRANQSNGKSDKETAQEALGEGHVLFWLVDCERGTTVSADIEMIKEFKGKKVIIFNKADKKGEQESQRIVEDAARVLYKEIPQEEIIDILAYSTLDDRIYYSKNKLTLDNIIKKAKESGNGENDEGIWKDLIEMLFDDEIEDCHYTIKSVTEDYEDAVDYKKEREQAYSDIKYNDDNYITSEVRDVIVHGYSELLDATERISNAAASIRDSYSDFYDAVDHWDTVDHECWTNTLTPILQKFANQFNSKNDNLIKSFDYKFWKTDYRSKLAQRVQDCFADEFKDSLDYARERCDLLIERKNVAEQMIKDMEAYKQTFMSALKLGIQQYKSKNDATNLLNEEKVIPNVFDAIKKNDYKLFLRSFENGVDLSVSNADGYNPMTLAIAMGNNMMVQFLLDNGADPSVKDRRGYNAFHTAVENQYRDICKMLLDTDPDLLDSKTNNGESVEDLAKKQTFNKWLKKEIDNAL